ncbi:MAG: hypothetical protein K2J08_07655 [Ruminococcus sp.]|nr:hypothetical protein [Ruminococcus sp.]
MKSKIFSFVTSATLALSSALLPTFSACAENTEENKSAESQTLKIMPIGDSITHGYQSSGGYRKFLSYFLNTEDFLIEHNISVDFVGPNSDYPETFKWINKEEVPYDSNHCGFSGYAIQYMEGTETRQGILETLQDGNMLETYDPDIVLLQIGTNDILSNYNDGITDRLENLINYISDNTDENTKIFVSSIPDIDAVQVFDWFWSYGDLKYNSTPEEFDEIIQEYVNEYNESIPVLVKKLQDEGKNVRFADVGGSLEKEYSLKDGVHPNENGYMQMAVKWDNAILWDIAVEIWDSEEVSPYKIADLISLSNYVIGRRSHHITEENFSLYDLNQDGVLDSFDVGILKQLVVERSVKDENQSSSSSGSHSSGNVAFATEITELD